MYYCCCSFLPALFSCLSILSLHGICSPPAVPSDTRQAQIPRARPLPWAERCSLCCAVSGSCWWPLGCHVLYPTQLHQQKRFQRAQAEPAGHGCLAHGLLRAAVSAAHRSATARLGEVKAASPCPRELLLDSVCGMARRQSSHQPPCAPRGCAGPALIRGAALSSSCWRGREAVWIDCLDSCLQNHTVLRHPGDALPFKDHKCLAT